MKDRSCYFCKYYKDEYCENLELKPCCPKYGCDDFNKRPNYIERDLLDKIKEEIKREREETYKMLGHEFGFDRIVTYTETI